MTKHIKHFLIINKQMKSYPQGKKCIACNGGYFAGDMGEVKKYLCDKHKEDYDKMVISEIKNTLKAIRAIKA